MMNTKRLFYLVLLFPIIGIAQEASLFVIASQGNYDKTQTVSLEWTLGQSFIQSLNGSNEVFSQGFHQPLEVKNLNIESSQDDSNIIISPNPVRSELNVTFSSPEELLLNLSLYDINGRLIKQTTTLSTNRQIVLNVTSLSMGIYILRISNLQGTITESHKIIKH